MKKRIALAAVAALAGGLLVAAPATAAGGANAPFFVGDAYSKNTTGAATETATAIAGTYNFVELEGDANGETLTVGSTLTLTGGTFQSTNVGTLSADKTVITFDTTTLASELTVDTNTSIKIATPAAGTITAVFKAYSQTGGQVTLTTGQTFTITVLAAVTSTLYDHTKVSAPETVTGATAYVTSAGAILAPKGTAGSPVVAAKVTATQYANAAETTETADTSAKAWTATITGVGLISESTGAAGLGTYLVKAAGANNVMSVYVYSDGRAGVATITFTVDGVAQTPQTVTLYGAGASYEVTNNNPHIADGETGTVTVLVKDANGVVVPGETVNPTSATTTVATVSAAAATSTAAATLGKVTFTVTAVDPGTSVVTFRNNAVAASATVSGTATAKVTKAVASSVALAFDKAEYAPGEKATITVTLKDANGDLLGDKGSGVAYNVFTAAATSTQAIQGTLPAAAIVTASGVKTYTVYMPLVAGSISVSAVLSADAAIATALQGTTVSASAKVVAPVDATVTAINAKVASTEATVAALQVTVASVIKSLKVQWWLLKKIAVKVGIKLG